MNCPIGYYLDSNRLCPQCDHTVCATCNTDAITCDKPCNGDCKTCETTGFCIDCVDGKYLKNGKCLPCDNTRCGTC